MIEDLVVVGFGEHGRTNLGPSLQRLAETGHARLRGLIDIEAPNPAPQDARVQARPTPEAPLAPLIRSFGLSDPIVYLAHAHDRHAPDALELLDAGFRVIVEKPYALDHGSLGQLTEAAQASPGRLALAQYYLMMKAVPLLHSAGLLSPSSFYTREPGFLQAAGGLDVHSQEGCLDQIGRPRMIYADILKGAGRATRLEHRGRQFADTEGGAGMILDLAIHAMAPIMALSGIVGDLSQSVAHGIRTAVNKGFLKYACNRYGIPKARVPETYAELSFETSFGVPVRIAVGKYILPGRNQRRIIIVGDEGVAFLDLSGCVLHLAQHEQESRQVLLGRRDPEHRYLAVLRACLAELSGASPFLFDARRVALTSNRLMIEAHHTSRAQAATRPEVDAEVRPGQILPS